MMGRVLGVESLTEAVLVTVVLVKVVFAGRDLGFCGRGFTVGVFTGVDLVRIVSGRIK